MSPEPLVGGLPPDCQIGANYIIRLTALDPATGAVVSGVSISGASVFATVLAGSIDNLVPLPKLVPTDQTV